MKPLDPRLVRRSAAVRRYLLSSAALGTVAAGLIVAQSWIIAQIAARGFDGEPLGAMRSVVLALVGVFVARSIVMWAHQVASTRAASRTKKQLRIEITEAVLDPQRIGVRPDSAQISTLLGAGLDALDNYFSRYLPQLILAVTVPASVVAAMFWADWVAGITVLITLPLIPLFMYLVGWMTKERTEKRWNALLRLSRHFGDVIDGIVVLKLFSRDQTEALNSIGDDHRKQTMAALRLAFLSGFVLDLLATISVALVAVGVGLRIVEDQMSLAVGLFVLLLAPEAFLPVRQVGTHFHASAEGVAAADDALQILDYPFTPNGQEKVTGPQRIEFAEVEVRYPNRSIAALGPVSFAIEPNEITAIVGTSGSGKSTAVSLLLGLAKPNQGSVRIGDIDIEDIDQIDWRKQIAWVPQRPGLVAGTIAQNVAFGDEQINDAQIRQALDDAGADYLDPDEVVVEQGANFSAGERRRIALARALAKVRANDGWLLILDEPTAGLDAQNERQIIESIKNAGKTVILISHREVDFADTVIEIKSSAVMK